MRTLGTRAIYEYAYRSTTITSDDNISWWFNFDYFTGISFTSRVFTDRHNITNFWMKYYFERGH
jgi:hypothetical protein